MKLSTSISLHRYLIKIFLLVVAILPLHALALGDPGYVETRFKKGHFPLVGDKVQAQLYVDSADYPGVIRSVKNLQLDIERVTDKKLELLHDTKQLGKTVVIIGSIGKSAVIDQLIADGKVQTDDIAGKWDAYHIEVVRNPLPGITQALVIIGSNKRGTSYGVYDLSEQIGVSPWYWWADVPVDKKTRLYIAKNTQVQDAPKVKYRGIFLNDEAPALTNWVTENYGNYNSQFYEKVFELLLRLKANYLWPAMWNNAFADDDPQNMILADEYGIVMGTSHHEPMMRADKEWNRYGEGPWEYSKNPENLYKFWTDGAKRNKPYESVYTMGMRGQQDEPMSEGENIGLLEKIVRDQRQIISTVFDDRDVTEVPQVWALYKEVQGFYERGMRVPDDVILLWCDDNWGNIRRLPTPEERKRPGGAGVYYHFDYVGGPRSYRWINTVPIAKIWEQMNLAYHYDANQIWIVNVGDLKPMEFPTEFFLRMAWNPEQWPKERLKEFGRLWAEREFGPKHAAEIEELITGYTRHNSRRKPELQEANIYSQLHYNEANRITAEIKNLAQRADALYAQMPASHKDAFYQLVLHPVKASAIITEMYDMAAKNRLYAHQGRANTAHYADQVRALFDADAALTNRYHTELSNGKWNHMMSQPRIGYTHWNNPPVNTLPVIYQYEPHSAAEMGIAIEGKADAWPTPGTYALDEFTPHGQSSRRIEIFNKGTAPFNFLAKPSAPWIIMSHTSGQVNLEQPIDVSIDWKNLPVGRTSGNILITGPGWGGARIQVNVYKPDNKSGGKLRGFVEADGYVAIEAENFSEKKSVHNFEWQKIEQHGRTLSSMSVFPITDYSFSDPKKAPYVEYDVFFFSTGEFTVDGFFAPSLPFTPGRGLRYAVSFDNDAPQIVDIVADMSDAVWEESVRNDIRISRSKHKISRPGLHKLKIFMIDPAVTLQKIVIDTGGLQPSYLGPQQSLRVE
jgi:hypothetical protein